jgi:uncharacterized membrane protein
MRVGESLEINAPAALVWEHVSDPGRALDFMSGITRWEVAGDRRTGLGARYRMLMRVGSADVGGLIEVVEFSPECDLAWTSVTGIDQRGRWRLRGAGEGRTRTELRLHYGVAGSGLSGWLAEQLAAPMVRANLRRTLRRLKRAVEQEQTRAAAAQRRSARA